MSDSSYPRCAELQQLIGQLETQVTDLLARISVHAGNPLSLPSANPTSTPKLTNKKKSKRRQGGQLGHPPKLEQFLLEDQEYLAGWQGVSRRGVEEIASDVFGATISLGTVSNLEGNTSDELETAWEVVLALGRDYKHWGKPQFL